MLSDLRYAFRQLARSPGFTAVVVLSLAIGIGSTTTAFCWLKSVWLNPLPGTRHQEDMYVLATRHGATQGATCSLPDIEDLRKHTELFDGIIGSQITPACIRIGPRQEWIYGQVATANFFDVLGVKPILGRTFLADEDKVPGGNPVLVISETYWKKSFGGSPDVVGRPIEINRHPFTIIGVVPSEFFGTMSGLRCDFWAPLSMHREVATFGSMESRTDRWIHTQVRLKSGVTRESAQAAVDVASQQMEKAYPKENTGVAFSVLPFAESPYGVQPVLLPAFRVLLVVSFGVLLIVVANVANLLLARGRARQREIAIRLAVGASRTRLMRQLLSESLVLALLGGAAGLLLTVWMLDLLKHMTPSSNLPIGIEMTLDSRALGFSTLVSLSAAVLFGFVPAWQCTRPDLNSTLKEGGRGAVAGRSHHLLRRLFVVSQIAVSLTLLTSAGLCLRSTQKARHGDFGFDPAQLLVTELRIGMNGYDEETGKLFYQKLQQHFASVPSVTDVALSNWFPLGFARNGSHWTVPEGYQPKPGEDMGTAVVIVSPNYFNTMKVPLLAGRDFTDNDTASSEPVVVVNEAFAHRHWPGQDVVGRRFREGDRMCRIIGVVKTGKYYSINEPAQPMFFRTYRQGAWNLDLGLVVRTSGDPSAIAKTIRDEIHRLNPGVEIWSSMPMRDHMKAAFMAPVLASRILTAMGIIALGLASLGVYAVMTFVVNERTQEFGLRMALGATPRSLLSLVLRNGFAMAAWGVGCGLLIALAASRLLAHLLYDVSPFDPLTFVGVPLLLGAVALAAVLVPARRAMQADPAITLRSE